MRIMKKLITLTVPEGQSLGATQGHIGSIDFGSGGRK